LQKICEHILRRCGEAIFAPHPLASKKKELHALLTLSQRAEQINIKQTTQRSFRLRELSDKMLMLKSEPHDPAESKGSNHNQGRFSFHG
jgi:hypothetical protein